jgi:hypothetical protein
MAGPLQALQRRGGIPHEHLLEDAANIQRALDALQSSLIDPNAALDALGKVYLMQEGLHFGEPVYHTAMARRDPNFKRIGFGGAAHVVPPIDLTVVHSTTTIEAEFSAAAKSG